MLPKAKLASACNWDWGLRIVETSPKKAKLIAYSYPCNWDWGLRIVETLMKPGIAHIKHRLATGTGD